MEKCRDFSRNPRSVVKSKLCDLQQWVGRCKAPKESPNSVVSKEWTVFELSARKYDSKRVEKKGKIWPREQDQDSFFIMPGLKMETESRFVVVLAWISGKEAKGC